MAVLPYHHPLELVKRLGTLDVLSGGRVIAGVGVGSLQPEFEVLGHAFAGRGERSDDAIRAIRAAWGQRVPEYHGTHYDFEGFIVEPSGLSREVEVWVGGRTRRSLRRAIELGDAWMPFGFKLGELAELLTSRKVRDLKRGFGGLVDGIIVQRLGRSAAVPATPGQKCSRSKWSP